MKSVQFAIVLAIILPLALSLPRAALAAPGQSLGDFSDTSGSWAEPQIRVLLAGGVLSVPPDGLFHPDDPVDRLDFAVWMAHALELPEAKAPAFSDWAQIPAEDQPAVAATVAAGLLKGYPDGSFRPKSSLTRIEMAVIFGRALQDFGEQPSPNQLTVFGDSAEIPTWAPEAALPVTDQLIFGRPGATRLAIFAPFQLTTRAESVTIIVRFLMYTNRYHHVVPLAPPPTPPTLAAGALRGFWYTNTDEGYANLQAHGTALNWLIYTGYNLEDDGSLQGYDSPRTLAWVKAHPLRLDFMIQSPWADDAFLHSAAAQQATVSGVLAVLQRAGYSGVNVDIEGIPAGDRAAFTSLIGALAAAVHGMGRQISVDVPAEVSGNQSWDGAFDYAALGRLVDQVVLMTYDQHYPGSDPGPVGALDWTQRVVSYATSVIPPQHVILGLPAYGYLWSSAGGATAYWETGMESMAARHAAAPQDTAAGEATFSYASSGKTYVGWFVDAPGLAARLELAKSAGLGGVMAWRLDYDTDWWGAWGTSG